MISIHELYHLQDLGAIDEDGMLNLHQLHYRLNFLRRLTPFEWLINRGFSTAQEQIEIYKKLNKPPVMSSCHLIGAAADVSDPKGQLKKWILENLHWVELMDLYMESFDFTGGLEAGWVHFQIFSPPSGNRFFIP